MITVTNIMGVWWEVYVGMGRKQIDYLLEPINKSVVGLCDTLGVVSQWGSCQHLALLMFPR